MAVLPGLSDDTAQLRRRRRQVVANVLTELEGLYNFLQDYAATRAAMHKLNEVLDALCEHRPDYVCRITRDIMRMPVTASSGKTYEASALRAHCAAQRSHGMQPTCPLTTKVLRPEQVWVGQGNFSLKGCKSDPAHTSVPLLGQSFHRQCVTPISLCCILLS